MRIYFVNLMTWFTGALVMVFYHSSYWAGQFGISFVDGFMGMALPLNIATLTMALIGAVIQGICIKNRYFHLWGVASILIVGITTISTLLALIAVIIGIEELIELFEDGGIYLFIIFFAIPCFVLTTVAYFVTHKNSLHG